MSDKFCTGHPTHLAFVDDEKVFLDTCSNAATEYFPGDMTLETVYTREVDPIEWVRERLEREPPLDTLYVDENMIGMNAPAFLDRLRREVPRAKYLPIVVMTAFIDEMDAGRYVEQDALRYIPKFVTTGQSGGRAADTFKLFLLQALISVPHLRGQMEDNVWAELSGKVAERLAQPEAIEKVIAYAGGYLAEHFGACAFYVRECDGAKLRLRGGGDTFAVGSEVDAAAIPFLAQLLTPGGTDIYRCEALTAAEVGIVKGAVGYRAIAAPLRLNDNRFGTIAVYRKPNRHPFRSRDELFLRQIALQIAADISEQRETVRLRQRQAGLAHFIDGVSREDSEQAVLDRLGEYLHHELHFDDCSHAKTTIRLVVPGSGEIPRRFLLGLAPNRDDGEVKDIHCAKSTYARVILSGDTEIYGNAPVETSDISFVYTNSDVKSALTVALKSAGQRLGAVNLEDTRTYQYTEHDRAFVEALAGAAATVLLNQRAQQFLAGLLALVRKLVATPAAAEDALADAFRLLHRFIGYARLLHLVPGSDAIGPWRVLRVVGGDGETEDEQMRQKWDKFIQVAWERTFIRRTLTGGSDTYTEHNGEFCKHDDLGVETRAVKVIHLFSESSGGGSQPATGLLALLFLMPGAVTPGQHRLLDQCGRFIGDLFQIDHDIRTLLRQRTVERQQVEMGLFLGQFRHRLRNQLGLIGNSLAKARRDGVQGDWLDRAQAVLRDVGQEITNSRFLLKMADPVDCHLAGLLGEISTHFQGLAAARTISLAVVPDTPEVTVRTDPDIVRLIVETLVQNAIEQCAPGDTITLMAGRSGDGVGVTVEDTGPGIHPSVRERLFQLGATTRSDGTGFGLHFARLRARELGGELRYRDPGHKGAAFTLTLPVS